MGNWDAQTAKKYDAWWESPAGSFALHQERNLAELMISSWPRRHQTLLDIGCGTGIFTQFFWEAGFAVTGLDASQHMLERARQKLDPKVTFQVGQAAHLPYDDREFDFSSLITVLEFCREPARVLLEAARVSRKGLVIGFLNKCSPYYLTAGKRWPWAKKGILRQAQWFTYRKIKKCITTTIGNRPFKARSIMIGPKWTWKNNMVLRSLNAIVLPPYFGVFTVVRVDLVGEKAITPLMAFKNQKQRQDNNGFQPITKG